MGSNSSIGKAFVIHGDENDEDIRIACGEI